MNEEDIKKIIREYASSSLEEITLKLESPLPYEYATDEFSTNNILTFGSLDQQPSLEISSDDKQKLCISTSGIQVGSVVLIDSTELTLLYLFDTLLCVFLGGVRLSPSEIQRRGKYSVIREDIYFNDNFAISFAQVDNQQYKQQLKNVLTCKDEELAIYMVDEQPGVRKLAEIRYPWREDSRR